MALAPGQVVTVPLGQRLVQGVVFELTPQPQVEPVKDVGEAWDPAPLLSPTALLLARWTSRYYLSSLFEAAALFLPPGFRTRARANLHKSTTALPNDAPLPEAAPAILRRLSEGTAAERDVLEGLGREGQRALGWLLARGYVRRSWDLPRPKLAPRYVQYLIKPSVAREPVASLPPRQAALMDALGRMDTLLSRLGTANRNDPPSPSMGEGWGDGESPPPSHSFPQGEGGFALLGALSRDAARKEYGDAAVRALMKKGFLGVEWVRVESRPPLPPSLPGEVPPSRLTPHQRDALASIRQSLEGQGPRSFLLYGVTGSGKTEVYLQALASCIGSGRRGIVLVPEISMTPQALHRLTERFPGRVAVLHSKLTPRQQSDQWWRIREGLYDVVVGPRSALFAPLSDLGLVVVDEEHEWTYKQADQSPRYHAREVALRLAELSGAVAVLGSATPDVVSYHDAQRDVHRLLTLPDRIAATDGGPPAPVADVEVVDMRRELREGNRSMFSRALSNALVEEVGRGQQAILFLNRRGEATSVLCRDCGYLARCRRCDVPLTYHSDGYLLCHQCNVRTQPPRVCPQCRSPRIRYLGLGTQRVVEELGRLLPDEPVLRWDTDVASSGRGDV
jgi:primosomal protein N' (replication factor Y)